ncbi:phosphatase PAP2 family protein [Stenotrophomonas sp. MMGLT7]|uniref:phosphatase PAP2 family protein n=1 Tax=Stenotrophomonas sp. MMGLT7 TaxID=2901227 RepID=UPI001E399975|nr:phosphatase PAP2 family protein [Stenotrophomonas sp. MMGLT7]MCD7097006.1 phosphatase PAP2 family protein [Stenotrophomonas sp. MMGLT7]
MSPAPEDDGAPVEAAGLRHWMRRNAWRFVLLFVGVLAPLAVFAALGDEVHEFEDLFFDEPVLWRMRQLASPGWDGFFAVASKIGYEGVIPADIAIVLLLLLWRRWRESLFAGVAFVGSALLNMGSKQFFQRDRPSLWDSIAPEHTFSFPSGHAMGSMTLAATVVLLGWHTRWRWAIVLAAAFFVAAVGLSRLYLGVHYPSDILGGWCAGLAWVTGVYLVIFRRRHPWRRRRG